MEKYSSTSLAHLKIGFAMSDKTTPRDDDSPGGLFRLQSDYDHRKSV
ncbi:hypothetical protein DB42_EA00170 [Neochlamydia sp. EPS4]|nr:hypothetical protein DB42_EA00170 [Neochlamydia sp. EPS4]